MISYLIMAAICAALFVLLNLLIGPVTTWHRFITRDWIAPGLVVGLILLSSYFVTYCANGRVLSQFLLIGCAFTIAALGLWTQRKIRKAHVR